MRGQTALAQPFERTDGRQSVEPAPHSACPQQHSVLGADLRKHPSQDRPPGRLWRAVGKPEGNHVDEQAKGRVSAVEPRLDQAGHSHPSEPEVALLLARAHHQVGHRALAEHRFPGPSYRGARVVGHRLQDLDHLGVVEICDEPNGHARDEAQQLRRQALGHHHVVGPDGPQQLLEVRTAGPRSAPPGYLPHRWGRAPPPSQSSGWPPPWPARARGSPVRPSLRPPARRR